MSDGSNDQHFAQHNVVQPAAHTHHETHSVAPRGSWANGLFDCCAGGPVNCMYGWCFPQCAAASARSAFDGSNCIFNACCVGLTGSYNIIREGYKIPGDCLGDVLITMCCPQCAAVRLVNEPCNVAAHREECTNDWRKGLFDCFDGGPQLACGAFWCPQCVAGQARTNYDHSNCWFNSCCLPQAANYNIIREGQGIKGDCLTDILINCMCPCCAAAQMYQQVEGTN